MSHSNCKILKKSILAIIDMFSELSLILIDDDKIYLNKIDGRVLYLRYNNLIISNNKRPVCCDDKSKILNYGYPCRKILKFFFLV